MWETRARVSQLVFNYTAPSHVLGEASTIAANMQIVPWQYSLATRVLFEQDADATQRVLRKLAPDNCIVFLVSKDFEAAADQTEKYYGTKFSVDVVNASTLEAWGAAPDADEAALAELHVQAHNEFIPRSTWMQCDSLVCSPQDFLADAHELRPAVVRSASTFKLWYKLDRASLAPLTAVRVRLALGVGFSDARAVALLHVVCALANAWAERHLSDALQLNYRSEVRALKSGLEFSFVGFSDKITEFAATVVHALRHFRFSPREFHVAKETALIELNSFQYQRPFRVAGEHVRAALLKYAFLPEELRPHVGDAALEDVREFTASALNQAYAQIYVTGNARAKQAESFAANFTSELRFLALEPSLREPNRVRALPAGATYALALRNRDAQQPDSATVAYFQLAFEDDETMFRAKALLLLTTSVAEPMLYTHLRSEKQLGYIVGSTQIRIENSVGWTIIVQGQKERPEVVDAEITACLRNQVRNAIANMSETRFLQLKKSVKLHVDRKLPSLDQRVAYVWEEIVKPVSHYNKQEEIAAAIDATQLDDLV